MESFGSWSVLTTNFLIILYIAVNGVTLAAILHLVNGKWREHVRFLSVSLFALFPLAFVLLIILLVGGEHTFQWLAHAHDGGGEGHHMPGWHNYTFLVTRQIVAFLVVAGLYGLFIKYQADAVKDDSYAVQRRFRNVALLIPFVYVSYATMVAWDFEMTMIPSWHSASYGAYHFISLFQFFLAFFAIFLFVLKRSGKLRVNVPDRIINYIAQVMLGFTILWTYLYFTQYLIMWYGRLPEEIVRFRNMMDNDLSGIWWTFLAMKFVIPFCSLIFARVRNTPALVVAVATSVVIGTWLERYTWISGSVSPEHYHTPMTSGFDILVTILVAGAAFMTIRWSLNRFGLVKPS
ncbi:MAG: hypothetical protein OEZ58_12680 [Gammaproteobacteria bacterium]|nr:hypothetical protein [Gammaproteobacteria bacterium]MDH5729842.1 hypothetical protein [Gammaproteobacteria bacterium]